MKLKIHLNWINLNKIDLLNIEHTISESIKNYTNIKFLRNNSDSNLNIG